MGLVLACVSVQIAGCWTKMEVKFYFIFTFIGLRAPRYCPTTSLHGFLHQRH